MTGVRPHVLQWGCGRWGAIVLRDLLALGAEVTVVEPERALAAQAVADGARQVIAAEQVGAGGFDGVVVVTPASQHGVAVRASAGLGRPIFCEKPLTADPGEAAALVADLGDRLFVMHKWRWHPGIEALARLVSAGDLGDPVGITCTRLGMDLPQADVDVIDTLAPHDLSIILAVLGRIPDRVAAAVGEPWPERPGWWLGCHALLDDGEGPWAALHCSGRAPGSRLRRVEVAGATGVAVLPDPYSEHLLVERGAGVEQIPLPQTLPLRAELAEFLEHCRGGPPPRSTAAEGLAVVQALALVRAALDARPA